MKHKYVRTYRSISFHSEPNNVRKRKGKPMYRNGGKRKSRHTYFLPFA